MAIYEARNEAAGREALSQKQLERLQAVLNRTYRHVPYYREAFDRAGVAPEDVRSLDDLARLPLTGREDLLAHQPYGMLAVPLHDVLRLHPAAGAGGPIVVGYTANDLAIWRDMAARALTSAGVAKDDVVQISLDYALDPAASGAQAGAEALGASVIPCSRLSPERQAQVLRNYRATVLVATPSQALQIARVIVGADPAELSLRAALVVGEVWSAELRQEIELSLRVAAFASYGMSEMAVPGLATECEHHLGLHISEDHVLAEVVDPATGEPAAPGTQGELVLTTLTREAAPMIRYRTGDLTVLDPAPCPCGRTLVRMAPTHARADDVLIVDGMRVTPGQVRELVREVATDAPCLILTETENDREQLVVRVGIAPARFEDEIKHLEALRRGVQDRLFEQLGLYASVRLAEAAHVDDWSAGPPHTPGQS